MSKLFARIRMYLLKRGSAETRTGLSRYVKKRVRLEKLNNLLDHYIDKFLYLPTIRHRYINLIYFMHSMNTTFDSHKYLGVVLIFLYKPSQYMQTHASYSLSYSTRTHVTRKKSLPILTLLGK